MFLDDYYLSTNCQDIHTPIMCYFLYMGCFFVRKACFENFWSLIIHKFRHILDTVFIFLSKKHFKSYIYRSRTSSIVSLLSTFGTSKYPYKISSSKPDILKIKCGVALKSKQDLFERDKIHHNSIISFGQIVLIHQQ